MGFFDSWKVKASVHLKQQVVFPGNVVEGYVQIVNDSDSYIQYEAVRVKLTAKEKVRVEERETVTDEGERGERQTFEEEHIYHKHLITLAGHMKQSMVKQPLFDLPPGTFTYPFAFQLPVNLPASFEEQDSDTYGLIQYYVKAYVDIPSGRDACAKSFLTVLSAMPQTQHDHEAGNFTHNKHFEVDCCCISKGSVEARIYCTRSVIAVDRDQLQICADINNQNGEEEVLGMEVHLWNRIGLRAQGRTGGIDHQLAHLKLKPENGQPIAPGSQGRIIGTVHLNTRGGRFVPSFTSHTLSSKYELEVELDIDNASDPSVKFPAIVVHCVDTTNFLPRVLFDRIAAPGPYPRGCPPMREDMYYPPQNPVCPPQPIPNSTFGGIVSQQPPMTNPWAPQGAFLMAPPPGVFQPSQHYNPQQYNPLAQGAPPPQWQGGVQYQTMAAPPPGTGSVIPYGTV